MYNDEKCILLLSYVYSSKYRPNIIIFINNELKTPSQISKKLNISTNHTSNLLAGLKKHDLIRCKSITSGKGRLYELTEDGKRIYEYIS